MRRVLLIAVLLVGCTENAVLQVDLTIETLEGTSSAAFVLVDAQSRQEFNPDREDEVRRVVLQPDATRSVAFAVDASEEHIEQPLFLRVRVCDDDCASPVSTHVLAIDRAFYLGRQTSITRELTDANVFTDMPIEVPVCQVAGCDSGGDNFCFMGTERHFCEGAPP